MANLISNGPDLVADLRRLDLDLPSTRAYAVTHDDCLGQRGAYYRTIADRRKLSRWLSAHG